MINSFSAPVWHMTQGSFFGFPNFIRIYVIPVTKLKLLALEGKFNICIFCALDVYEQKKFVLHLCIV